MYDWTDTERTDRLVYELVDPMSLDSSRGTLTGVKEDGLSITQDYYSDERVSASIDMYDTSGYIDNSLIRVHHYVDAWDYHDELGTFYVADDSGSRNHGLWGGNNTLRSAIYGLVEDHLDCHWAINKDSYTTSCINTLLKGTMRPYRVLRSAYDRRIGSTTVYKIDDTVLSILFDLCNLGRNRLELDDHGTMEIQPYVNPRTKTPVWAFRDPDPMILGKIDRSTNRNSSAARSTVVYSNGDTEIVASAHVSAGNRISSPERGRMVSVTHSLTDMNPATYAEAHRRALEYNAEDSAENIIFSFDCRYIPLRQGDAVTLDLDEETHLCLVKTVDTKKTLGSLKNTLTPKKVG